MYLFQKIYVFRRMYVNTLLVSVFSLIMINQNKNRSRQTKMHFKMGVTILFYMCLFREYKRQVFYKQLHLNT